MGDRGAFPTALARPEPDPPDESGYVGLGRRPRPSSQGHGLRPESGRVTPVAQLINPFLSHAPKYVADCTGRPCQ